MTGGGDTNNVSVPVDETRSESPVSRHSSIRGPYRQYRPPNTFARCNLVSSVAGVEETYSRSLFSSGNGFAPWNVSGITSPRPAKHIENGVDIGDVGLMDLDGDFVYLFNIFTPKEDPLHSMGVPDRFEQLDLNPGDIRSIPNHFPPQTIIASKGVDVTITSKDPFEFKFSTIAREGALLVLPDGASREDLVSTARLTKYIGKHALNWYRYMYSNALTGASMVPNGTLYLITGCDKAQSYTNVAIPTTLVVSGDRHEAAFEDGEWEINNVCDTMSYAKGQDGDRSFSVFIRGIRIALSDHLWSQNLSYEPPDGAAYYQLLTTPILGLYSRFLKVKERHFGRSSTVLSDRQKVPFHPSLIISQILLQERPNADFAIVEDSVWCDVVETGADGTLPRVIELVARGISGCDIIMVGRIVTLVKKPPEASAPKPNNNAGFVHNLFHRKHDPLEYKAVLRKVKTVIQLT